MAKKLTRRDAFKSAAVSSIALGASSCAIPAMKNEKSQSSKSEPLHKDTSALVEKLQSRAPDVKLAPPDSHIKSKEAAFTRDENAWAAIVRTMQETYQIDLSAALSAPAGAHTLKIDQSFSFVPTESPGAFRFQFVEQLLEQAADLLDRGLRLQAEWDDLAVKAFTTGMELKEYYELDKIHRAETEAGYYTLAQKESAAELSAQSVLSDISATAEEKLSSLLNQHYSQSTISQQSGFSQLAAFISPGEKDWNVTWNGVPKTARLHAQDAATGTSYHYLLSQLAVLESQRQTIAASGHAAAHRMSGLTERYHWDQKDAEFRRSRTLVLRRLADLKTRAFTEPGGALNYPERMSSLRKRFERDFTDSLDRVFAAHQGLSKIFGYRIELPESLTQLQQGVQNNRSAFEDCLLWTRDALAYLLRFGQQDQNYVLPISVKEAVGDQWEHFLASGAFQFAIKEEQFPGQCHIRLQGVGAVVETIVEPRGLWRLTMVPPKNSYMRDKAGSVVPVDQSRIPPCWLGRVESRSSPRPPDVTGVVALHNCSPFGVWDLTVSDTSTGGRKKAAINDIEIDLHLAMRSSLASD